MDWSPFVTCFGGLRDTENRRMLRRDFTTGSNIWLKMVCAAVRNELSHKSHCHYFCTCSHFVNCKRFFNKLISLYPIAANCAHEISCPLTLIAALIFKYRSTRGHQHRQHYCGDSNPCWLEFLLYLCGSTAFFFQSELCIVYMNETRCPQLSCLLWGFTDILFSSYFNRLIRIHATWRKTTNPVGRGSNSRSDSETL